MTENEPQEPQDDAQEALEERKKAPVDFSDLIIPGVTGAPQANNLAWSLEKTFSKSLSANSFGEAVEFAVGITILPGPNGQPSPIGFLILAIPSLTLGEKVHSTILVPNLWISQEEADATVRDALEQMRAHRSAQSNGFHHPGQGL